MIPLDKSLRNKLEKTVIDARDVAEAAALAVLEQLGVSEPAPFTHLTEPERELRRKLRTHGRQLGDIRDPKKQTQEISLLAEEIAYEHWHRMLFARFLAENNLLMYPDPENPVPVTLEECEDLAADEGAANGWELAARFATRMLPQIFRVDSPVFKLILPPEHQQRLERLLDDLANEVFTASDSLGWVYQFWQAKRKDQINASEVKIGARELPAVTQRFTEPYMVNFLLDNSLGAWWAARRLSEADLKNAENEEELRTKAALPGVSLEYLRFVKPDDGLWTPAAGTFDGWPKNLSVLKTLDPCAGSGHFLVAVFLMLVPLRMEMEGLSPREAVDAVLRQNIHGLDIDERVVQIAAFALALAAWRYPAAGGYRPLPELHLACCGLSVGLSKEEWQKLSNGSQNLRIALGLLYDEFRNAPLLGSLLNPRKSDAAKLVDWNELTKAVASALKKKRSDEEQEAGVVVHGLAKAATLLSETYNWVITNVPYLSRGKQSQKLRDFCDTIYKEARSDLATVFLDRCLEFCFKGGTTSIVLPQNWLFLTAYTKFREKLLKNETWHLLARLGPGAFDTISGEVVKAILLSLSRETPGSSAILHVNPSNRIYCISCIDVSNLKSTSEKSRNLQTGDIKTIEQVKQLKNPDSRIICENIKEEVMNIPLLEKYALGLQGMATGDYPRYGKLFWELETIDNKVWIFQQSTVESTLPYGGRQHVLLWENGEGEMCKSGAARVQGFDGWGKLGIATSQMGSLPVTIYTGQAFDNNTAAIVCKNKIYLPAIWTFCSSSAFNEAVRKIDQSLAVTNATLVKVHFDLEYWQKVAAERYPNGLPKPYSEDPTQWVFHGHPANSEEPLQVAVARLLGYRWPAELDNKMGLSDEARDLVKKCDELLPHADADGIVCIPPVRGEATAKDRILNLLATAYKNEWNPSKQAELLKQADCAGKTLDIWLRDKFFIQHCKLFHHRPFIWHIWDGLRDGFSVLINYHRLDRKNLETLIYTYLGDWINRQKGDIRSGIDGAEEKLAAAESLKKKLEMILLGEVPCDIFVRWKPIEQQPIGWAPDINDGVRINIRPFMTVAGVNPHSAGVLRVQPNINWNKDRGKDVPSAPWYHLLKGERINDYHLSLEEKRKEKESFN